MRAVEQQQHHGDAKAQLLVEARNIRGRRRDALGDVEHRRQQDRDGQQQQQRGEKPDLRAAEGLLVAPEAADEYGDAEEQEAGADDRAGDLRLHDARLRLAQHEQREHEFGGVAEADVEQAADRAAGVLGDLLGAAPHPVGEDADRDETAEENPARAGEVEMMQRERERHEQQQRGFPDRGGGEGHRRGSRRGADRLKPRFAGAPTRRARVVGNAPRNPAAGDSSSVMKDF